MRKNRADMVHIMHSCSAFSENGVKVVLLTPKVLRKSYIIKKNKIFSLYGLKENFKINELNTNLRESAITNNTNVFITVIKKFIYHLQYGIKNRITFKKSENLIYGKCWISTLPYILLKKIKLIRSYIVFETEYVKNDYFHKFILKNSTLVASGMKETHNFLLNDIRMNEKKLIQIPNRFVIDLDIKIETNKMKIRNKLKYNNDKTYITYGGKTGVNLKNIDDFIEIAKRIPSYNFVIIGLNEDALKYYSKLLINNLSLVPFQNYKNYCEYLRASDILIANYSDTLFNRYYLGPQKAGPYLLSGNPVIFSDLPSLRDRFSDEIAYFVEPENIDEWVKKIKSVSKNKVSSRLKAKNAQEYVSIKNYPSSAKVILSRINKSLNVSKE